MMSYQIKMTDDGSHTLYLTQMDEQYHSLNGAITESRYVFIERGYLFHNKQYPVVLEVGFGTGLNCLLTAVWAEMLKRPTSYIAIEKYPLKYEVVKQLNYAKLITEKASDLFAALHESNWERYVRISPYFKLYKMNMDITKVTFELNEGIDIVYFDAFSPDKQQEMWTPLIFSALYEITLPGGVFVTYSAKGEVRRRLAATGFKMERLPGPPGKKEMLRGIKV